MARERRGGRLLALFLALAAARAQDVLPERPVTIEPIELEWYWVDGVPRQWGDIEGWVLADPAARRHAIARKQLRTTGAALTTFGSGIFIIAAGVAVRSLTDDDIGTVEAFGPVIGAAGMVAVGLPLISIGKDQERRAVAVYGEPVAEDVASR